MDISQQFLYLDAEDDCVAADMLHGDYVEPVIANTKTAIIANVPRFFQEQRDSEACLV